MSDQPCRVREQTTGPARILAHGADLATFCQRWKIAELSLFGSVLRDDFGPASDVDVLVSFAPDAEHTLFHLVELRDELQSLFGRPVDVVEARTLRNPFLRHEIMRARRVVYAA